MIVDTNILIAAVDITHVNHELCLQRLFALRDVHPLYGNEIIFAEISGRFSSLPATERAFASLNIKIVRLTLDDCFRAGQAFRTYRSRQGKRDAILPDFLIGAQADEKGWPILTFDRRGFASYFPNVTFVDPTELNDE